VTLVRLDQQLCASRAHGVITPGAPEHTASLMEAVLSAIASLVRLDRPLGVRLVRRAIPCQMDCVFQMELVLVLPVIVSLVRLDRLLSVLIVRRAIPCPMDCVLPVEVEVLALLAIAIPVRHRHLEVATYAHLAITVAIAVSRVCASLALVVIARRARHRSVSPVRLRR